MEHEFWFEHGLNGLTRIVLLAKQKSEKSVLSVFNKKKVVFNNMCFI